MIKKTLDASGVKDDWRTLPKFHLKW